MPGVIFGCENQYVVVSHQSNPFLYFSNARLTISLTSDAVCCPGYVGYPFHYMCADDEFHPSLFLLIHTTDELFHIALYPLIFEQISHVASTAHWRIENRLHWRRDVTLREDHCQVRKGEAPRILALLNSFL